MEFLQNAIRGPSAFFLILLILIVSGLLLAAVWLVLQRISETTAKASAPKEVRKQAAALQPSPVETRPVSAPSPVVESAPPAAVGAEESIALKDKVKYLESRLMEYEIVQEEISNLSQLRQENEKLKEELLKFQGGKKPEPAAVPPATADSGESGGPATEPNPILEAVSKNQVDTILNKLDEISTKA